MFSKTYYKNRDNIQEREWSTTGQYHGPAIVAQYFLHHVPPPTLCQGEYYNPIAGNAERWLWPRNTILLDFKVVMEAIQGIHNLFPAHGAVWNTSDDKPQEFYKRREEWEAIELEIMRLKRRRSVESNKKKPKRPRRSKRKVSAAHNVYEHTSENGMDIDDEDAAAVTRRSSDGDEDIHKSPLEDTGISTTQGTVAPMKPPKVANEVNAGISSGKAAWDFAFRIEGESQSEGDGSVIGSVIDSDYGRDV